MIEMNFKLLKQGLKHSLPLITGFIPACFTFGLVGKGLGVGSVEVFLLSALVFAGASQFIAVKLIAAGTAAPLILLLTFIINMRYLFIGMSFAGKIQQKLNPFTKAWIGFTLTEEVYAVGMMAHENQPVEGGGKRPLALPYLLGLQTPPYLVSLLSTAAGISLAAYVPQLYLPALNTSLYALLIALIVPQLPKSLRNIAVCISSALVSWALQPFLGHSSIMVAMLTGMGVGACFRGAKVTAAGGEA